MTLAIKIGVSSVALIALVNVIRSFISLKDRQSRQKYWAQKENRN